MGSGVSRPQRSQRGTARRGSAGTAELVSGLPDTPNGSNDQSIFVHFLLF